MFLRLFVTYLLLVVLAVAAVGLVVLRRADGIDLIRDLAGEVIPAAVALTLLAVLPAYLMARRLTRPLLELTAGTRRIADGDFVHKFPVAGSGELTDLARTFNDMTDRLAATFEQLDRDREQLRAILSGMVEGVVAIDPRQRVLFANDRAGQLLDFTPAVAVGRKLWDVTRQRAVRELVERALATDAPQRQELDWKGGAEKFIAVYVSRLPGPDSPGAVMVLHDTTDLRRLERMRADFVANVSHELKTPLANIKSSVEVLMDGAVEDAAIRGNFLSEIAEQADRQQTLIEDLLSLARIESTETGLAVEAVNVEEAVHACLDRHRTRAEAKRQRLDGVALAGVSPALAVWVDEEGLAQILDNLVDNAIKYTPPGGRITVRWKAVEEAVILEVEDTGLGIPERDQPRVFERFYRVDKARSRLMGGTGLGLAIVKHLAQAMHGTVEVTSQVDVGSTFRVTLPRTAGPG
jgi:two-component system phosphate regulon sensor histidine kinase PhoR